MVSQCLAASRQGMLGSWQARRLVVVCLSLPMIASASASRPNLAQQTAQINYSEMQ
jgi:hypothetical protein